METSTLTSDNQSNVKKREIFGWAMYDVANSAYTTIIITVVFSGFFTTHVVPSGGNANSYWGLAIAISCIIALLLSPFIGAFCDLSGNKKRFLTASTLICSFFTALLYFVGPGDIWLAVAIIGISNAAWMIGESVCASFLTDVSSKKNMGLISGIGWAVGYLGGLISLVIVLFVITKGSDSASTAEQIRMNQNAMLFTALFFLTAFIPTFIWLKNRIQPSVHLDFNQIIKLGIKRLINYKRLISDYPELSKFFISFTIYMAGYAAIIKFVGIYSKDVLTLSGNQLSIMFVLLQLAAFFGSLLFGLLDRFIGTKQSILITLVWWIMGILSIFYIENIALILNTDANTAFTYFAFVIGLALGATQSSSRTVVGLLTKEKDSALMFGLWGMFNRTAVLLGMTYGIFADMIGLRHALLLVIVFFVIGGLLFLRVNMKKGIEQASINQ